jgi:hypothetical protein
VEENCIMSFIIYTTAEKINGEMDTTCSKHEIRNVYKILARKVEGNKKRLLRTPTHIWEDNIKIRK